MQGAYYDLQRTGLDWQFETSPQPELGGRVMFLPRGKVLGGCSSINAMLFVRGHPENYNGWARAGCVGWAYNDLLPLFKRMEVRRGDGG